MVVMKFGLVILHRPSLLERDKRVRPISEQDPARPDGQG
jgi:hypothetical protein